VKRGVNGDAAKCTNTMIPNENNVNTKDLMDSFDSAKNLFTPEYLFIQEKVMKFKDQVGVHNMDLKETKKNAKADFHSVSATEKEKWEAAARAHLERHQRIPYIIRDVVRKNAPITYHGIANALGHWSSASTIQRWITSREGYKQYSDKVIPLLTQAQKEKHVVFAKHLLNNWSRGQGKYLLIHFDEKWFLGMLMWMTAKTFQGDEENVMKIYHTSETMSIAAVGMAFEDSLENGGIGVKMLFH